MSDMNLQKSRRIGDKLRDWHIRQLSQALAEGFIDTAEFEARRDRILVAKTEEEAKVPLSDLPPLAEKNYANELEELVRATGLRPSRILALQRKEARGPLWGRWWFYVPVLLAGLGACIVLMTISVVDFGTNDTVGPLMFLPGFIGAFAVLMTLTIKWAG